MNIVQIAYLAGIIDGEGSVSIVKDRNGFKPQLTISNNFKPLLLWCRDVVGLSASLSSKKPRKETHAISYDLRWSYNKAIQVAIIISPYIIVKKSQIRCLLKWPDVVKRNGRYAENELKLRNTLIDELRNLNQHGPR